MTLTLETERLPVVRDADGVLRIGGTRVTLDTIITAFDQGATAEEIAYQYPCLGLADVYSVLSRYLQNRNDMDEYIRDRREIASKIRVENELRFDPDGIRQRLLKRRAAGER